MADEHIASGASKTTTCPMASMCHGMMGRRGSSILMFIPGLALLLTGALILLVPQVLFWLVAALCAVMGIVALVMANFVRKMGAGTRGS